MIAQGGDEDVKRYMNDGELQLNLKEEACKELIKNIEKEVDNFEKISLIESFINGLRPEKDEKSLKPRREPSSDKKCLKIKDIFISTPKSTVNSEPSPCSPFKKMLDEIEKKREILAEIDIKLKEKMQALKDFDLKIDTRQKDMERLEKTNAQLVKSNSEMLAQIEMHSKSLNSRLESLSPDKFSGSMEVEVIYINQFQA